MAPEQLTEIKNHITKFAIIMIGVLTISIGILLCGIILLFTPYTGYFPISLIVIGAYIIIHAMIAYHPPSK